jgi:hypothetical protein
MYRRGTIIDHHTIGQIGSHNEIMFDGECNALEMHNEALNDLGSKDTLFRIQVSRSFVDLTVAIRVSLSLIEEEGGRRPNKIKRGRRSRNLKSKKSGPVTGRSRPAQTPPKSYALRDALTGGLKAAENTGVYGQTQVYRANLERIIERKCGV